jgi:peptidoglycan/LPS O-acetylase OafA/YrhL
VVSPIWLLALQTTGWLPNSAGMWLPAHLACFAGGMALAALRSVGVRCYAWAAIPLALVMFLIASTPIAGDVTMSPETVWQPLAKTVLDTTIATLVVAPIALGDRGRFARLLSSRPMVRLGEISYEIFLLHVVVMAVAMTAVLRWPLFTGSMTALIAVTLAITVPLAWQLHRFTHLIWPDHPSRTVGRTSKAYPPSRTASTSHKSATREMLPCASSPIVVGAGAVTGELPRTISTLSVDRHPLP